MRNKQNKKEAMEERSEKVKNLNFLECPHGNNVGWCDDCPEEYYDYVKNWLSTERQKVREETIKEVIEEIEKYENTRTNGDALDTINDIKILLKDKI